MTRPASSKITYTGYEALHEELWPDPTESEIERERLEAENRHLRDEVKHLRSALATAGRVLEPYISRLNGRES
jgi:hypothetical protein